ncbi:MAG: hypothetical protein U0136_18665 [Bdellovibrionota bacterium]
MFRKLIMHAFALTVLMTLVAVKDTSAASNLDCVADAQGRTLRWNSSWDKDRSDNGIQYKIVSVTQIDRIPTRKITLELKALEPASHSVRTAVVDYEDKARAFCSNIVVENKELVFPGSNSADLSTLPFIRFTRYGWVRDDPEPNTQLGVCPVGNIRFSCPEGDRLRFGGSLKTLEEELNAQVP